MKTCNKCRRRFPDTEFRSRTVTVSQPDIEGRTSQESHITSGGSVCRLCNLKRLRISRGTQTVHDVAQGILVDLRYR